MKTITIKRNILLLFITLMVISPVLAQSKFKVGDNGLNGIYSGYIKYRKGAKPQLVNIYIYEYIQYDDQRKYFCRIEQFQTKKPKGTPKIYDYYGYAKKQSDGSFRMNSTVGLGTSRPKKELTEMKFLPKGKVQFKGKLRSNPNSDGLINGEYERKSVRAGNFDKFLTEFYEKMVEFEKRIGGKDKTIYWGTAWNTQKRSGYYSRSQKKFIPVKLTTTYQNIEKIHNEEILEMVYNDNFTVQYGTSIEYLNDKIRLALNGSRQSYKNPIIYHFPYLKSLRIKNQRTGDITHTVKVQRDFYKFRFEVKPTDVGNIAIRQEKRRKEEALQAEKRKAEADRLAILEAKNRKDKMDAQGGINPSGIILSLDKTPKGSRNKGFELLFGKEYNDKINQLFEGLSQQLNQTEEIRVIDTERYFKNIFYGKFSDLKPEKVSRGLFGSNNYFPEFHNAFLFYANQYLGKNYYPDMITVSFNIITTRVRKDNWGNEISNSQSETPYQIRVPKVMSPKFNAFLNEGQFSWSGEEFNREFEYLILSFLSDYPPDSLVFKQMMQNLYRYSNGKKPVSRKADLVKL